MDLDSFRLATEPQAIYRRLLALDEFVHLLDARIACVFSEETPMLHGHPCWAFVGKPLVQGPFRPWFEWAMREFCRPLFGDDDADFLIIFHARRWVTLDIERRERLVYHELCHVVVRENEYGIPVLGDDGRPSLKLIPHDFEFFDAEVRRYGPEVCDLERAAGAIADGHHDAEQRQRRVSAA